MADPWHCSWANKGEKPDDQILNSWTLSRWLRRKALDTVQAIADINHTLSNIGGHDEAIERALAIEVDILHHMTETFPVDIPTIPEYRPRMIDKSWISSRVKELERQRDQFSTITYWKDPRPPKEHANKAIHLVTKAWGRYSQLTASDWRGLIEAFQDYINQVENIQLLLVVARNEQSFDDGKWIGSVARLAKKIRADYKSLHRGLLEDALLKYPALLVHPWKIDEGLENLSWEQYRSLPLDHWDSDMAGVPRLIDGPIFDRGSTLSMEEFIDDRRSELDQLLSELKAGRFAVLKGYLRRERKILGRAYQAIGQYKRHLVWPGQLEAMVAEEEIL